MVARPLRLKHSPQRRRVVPEGFAALADVAQAWPWKMISHGRDTLRCQHVEHAQARCHRLFAIGIERELTSWVLDHHRVVVRNVARVAQGLALRGDHIDRVPDGMARGRHRLDAESIRDSILFVAGDLNLKEIGGPSQDFGPENMRRTVYCKVSRFRLNNFLQAFDFPNPSFTAEQRFSTNVPVQRLYFMNNDFVYDQAGKLAERVFPKGTDEARIEEAYRLLFGRAPTKQEVDVGLHFLRTTPEKPGNLVNG